MLSRNLVDEQTRRNALALEVAELRLNLQENQNNHKHLILEKDLQITSLKSELGRQLGNHSSPVANFTGGLATGTTSCVMWGSGNRI